MSENKTTALDIDRETYKTVKHFDRQQLTQFCTNLYNRGLKAGRDSVPGVDVEQLYKVIASVPGIGAKRMELIKAAVENAFGQAGKEDTT